MYSAFTITDYIIQYCNKNKLRITNLQLQKILYFVQAEFLYKYNYECFKEKIEAWNFGPVVPIIYHRYKMFASMSLYSKKEPVNIRKMDESLINNIVEYLLNYSPTQLMCFTKHQIPWIKSYNVYEGYTIQSSLIKEYYNSILKEQTGNIKIETPKKLVKNLKNILHKI